MLVSAGLGEEMSVFTTPGHRLLDALELLVRVLIIAPHHRALLGPPLGLQPDPGAAIVPKLRHLPWSQRIAMIEHDFRPHTSKGYYVTGYLDTRLYRDDCVFDGPDPDMPIRGLRKYQQVASQLFDAKSSTCELQSLQIVNIVNTTSTMVDNDKSVSSMDNAKLIFATWQMQATLRLPWRPPLPTVSGATTYRFDHDGLIVSHVETWHNLSVPRAVLATFWPQLARWIWKEKAQKHADHQHA